MKIRFSSWRRSLYVISFGVFIAQISFTVVTPFLPMYLEEIGLKTNTSLWSGLIFSVNFVTYAFMAPVWGTLSDRYSRRVMLLRSGLGISATFVLMGLAQNHIQIFVLRAINGILSGYIPASIILAAAITPDHEMSYAMSIVQTASAVGAITGPLLGGFLAELIGMRRSFFFAAGVLSIAAILPYVFNVDDGDRVQKKSSIYDDVMQVMRNRSLLPLFVTWMLVQASIMGVQPVLPLFVSKMVEENVEMYTGIIFSVVGISTAIGAPLVGRIKRFSMMSVYLWGLFLGALFTAAQGLSGSPVTLALLRFIFGFANAAITVTANVLIAQYSGKENRGSSFGLLNTASAVGFVIGPLVCGFLGENFGLDSSFFGNAAMLALAFGIVLFAYNPHSRTTGSGLSIKTE